MKINTATLTTIAVLGLLPGAALAQNITARSTQMNWSSLYGGGPTGFNPSDTFASSALESTFDNTLAFSDSQSGTFPLGWTANVAISFNQNFDIQGPLNNFAQIESTMSGNKSQSASGIGVAGISSVLPGNELVFEFTVANTLNYRLNGSWASDSANTSFVKLEFWNGQWNSINNTLFLFQGATGNFDWTGQLGTGLYRIYSQNELLNGFNTFQGGHNYTFTNLDAVPEPGTLIALSALAIAAARRRKHR